LLNGDLLPEGEYSAELSVLYKNGNRPTASTAIFIIDVTPPSSSVSESTKAFSPNGDGKDDHINFTQITSENETWVGEILNSSGELVKEVEWNGKADKDFSWNGRDNENKLLPDDEYSYSLFAIDRAGNRGESKKVKFSIDTVIIPEVGLSINEQHFSPNNDGIKDSVSISPGFSSFGKNYWYNLTIKDTSGMLVHSLAEKSVYPVMDYTWDGRGITGNVVSDGKYSVELEMGDPAGNIKNVAADLLVDTKTPDIDLKFENSVFSPEGDGRRDTISIVQGSSNEQNWEGVIYNKANKKVVSFYWKGKAEPFSWDGTDAEGNIAPDGIYYYKISSIDRAGNKTEALINNIQIDTVPTPVAVGFGSNGFSPNNDGILDEIALNLYIEVREGIQFWDVKIFDDRNNLEKTL
jgi:gliding motility-associated-like protein